MADKRDNDTIIPINGFQSEINMSALSLASDNNKEQKTTSEALGMPSESKNGKNAVNGFHKV